jgi:hypothetical protein
VPRPRNYSGQLTRVFFFFKYCTSAGTLSKRKDFTLSSMVNISSIVFEIVNHVLFSSMKATNSNLRARTGHGRSGPGVQQALLSMWARTRYLWRRVLTNLNLNNTQFINFIKLIFLIAQSLSDTSLTLRIEDFFAFQESKRLHSVFWNQSVRSKRQFSIK